MLRPEAEYMAVTWIPDMVKKPGSVCSKYSSDLPELVSQDSGLAFYRPITVVAYSDNQEISSTPGLKWLRNKNNKEIINNL